LPAGQDAVLDLAHLRHRFGKPESGDDQGAGDHQPERVHLHAMTIIVLVIPALVFPRSGTGESSVFADPSAQASPCVECAAGTGSRGHPPQRRARSGVSMVWSGTGCTTNSVAVRQARRRVTLSRYNPDGELQPYIASSGPLPPSCAFCGCTNTNAFIAKSVMVAEDSCSGRRFRPGFVLC